MSTIGLLDTTTDGRRITQEVCDRLHFRKNGTIPREIDGEELTFPPYQYRPYPAALYGVWSDERKRQAILDTARLTGLDVKDPLQREEIEAQIPKWDSREVKNDQERTDWLSKGWTDDPNAIDQAHDAYLANVVAVAAAEQKYSDRNMGEKAKAEFMAADRASGDAHLIDLPVPPLAKKRGRPAKVTPPASQE